MSSQGKKGGLGKRKAPGLGAPPAAGASSAAAPAAGAPWAPGAPPAAGAPGAAGASPTPAASPAPTPPPMGHHAPPPMGAAAGWMNPWGGYVNMLQQPQFASMGENFHFVGLPQNSAQVSPPPPPSVSPVDADIDIEGDDGVKASRTARRRHWTHEEEVRLANAWLNNSNDPIKGNDKKGDTFWREITEEFNSHATADCQRNTNQLKVHWTQLKTTINDFNGCWARVTKVHKSGAADDQLMDEALQMYAGRYGKSFTLFHWWKTLKKEPKWCAYVACLEDGKKQSHSTIDVDEDTAMERPIGRDVAKAQRNGKRKTDDIMEGISALGGNIKKIVSVAAEHKQEREKVTEAQLEISRLKLKAAQEEKEAKLLLVYNSLLLQDTSQMTEEAKARREKSLELIENKLSAVTEEGES